MDNPEIKVLYTQLGCFISKIDELPGRDIGEPDCLLTDPCVWDHNDIDHHHDADGNHVAPEDAPQFIVRRFPGKSVSSDTQIAFHSSNIYTILEPTQALVSEYLITISD